MAESSLSLSRTELRTAVARYLGWPPSEDDRSSAQNTRLTEIINAGLREFYAVHDWTFLSVIEGSLSTTADDNTDDLPDTLAYIIGDITIDDNAENYPPIVQRGEEYIRRKHQADNTTTSKAEYFCVRPKEHDGSTGQRFELYVWPTWDGEYDLTYNYAPLASALTADAPYPLGGAYHSETLKAFCRAVAEREDHNTTKGPEWNNREERLKASIALDARTQPRNFGYNGDPTEGPPRERHTSDYTIIPT